MIKDLNDCSVLALKKWNFGDDFATNEWSKLELGFNE